MDHAKKNFLWAHSNLLSEGLGLSKIAVKTTIVEDVTSFKFYLPWVLEYSFVIQSKKKKKVKMVLYG